MNQLLNFFYKLVIISATPEIISMTITDFLTKFLRVHLSYRVRALTA